MKKKSIILVMITLTLLLLGIGACTPGEAEVLEGILENVDSVNGEITIVTKDGRTITLDIKTDTTVETEGTDSDLGTLEVGVSIEVEVNDDGKAVKHIEARQAKVEGNISGINGNEITVQSQQGRQVTVTIGTSTRIELDDDIKGTVADLQVGNEVEIKYDPETLVALKIEIEDSDDKGNGIVTASGLNWGIIEIRVTDPPPADVKSAVVWLTNIEVHRASGNSSDPDNPSGWIMVLESPSSFDLMQVLGGVEEILGSANLPAGRYTQIRMDVTEVTGNTTDGEPYTAEVPGGKLRIVRTFTIGNGDTTILTLDFDGEKSLIRTGNDRFIFKPVVKLSIAKAEKGEKGNRGTESEDEDEDEDEDEEDGQNNNELELEGVIVSIDGDIWTIRVANETTTVDVSGVEIEGEAATGSRVKVKGIMDNDVLVASQVEIKEPGP